MNLIAPPPILGPDDLPAPPFGAESAQRPVYVLPEWWFHPRLPVPSPPPPLTPTPAPVPSPHVIPYPAAIVEALNVERQKVGLAALEFDPQLAGVATYWSQSQALHGVMTHGPGSSFATRIWSVRPNTFVGECVAEGAASIEGVVAMWLASPPHRAIIMGQFTAAGAGVAYGRDGTAFWTFDVCRPA